MAAMKPRRPDTVEHAVTRVIADMGAETAGAAIGRSPWLLRKASDPDDDFCLSVEHCIGLDAEYQIATGEPGPIQQAYAVQVAKRAGALPYHEPGDPLERVVEVIKEGAEAADAYRACQPRSTPLMRTNALREIGEAIEAYQKMARDIEARDATVKFPAVAE